MANEPRTVVITGASRGLGLASAIHLYERGWKVIAAMRSVDAGLKRLREATGSPADDPRLLGVSLDLEEAASIEAAARRIESLAGAPDALVHNAGIAAAGSVEDTPMTVWHQIFATNLFGPVALTKALLPAMRTARRGRIVAISSQVAIRGLPGVAPYSASKSAFERWAESLAGEMGPFGLGVTLLVAGAFKTEIITERTPDYGDHQGPYAKHYAGIRRSGGAMIEKAGSPQKFARELARAVEEIAPFVRRPLGPDAVALSLMSRMLSSRQVHRLICPMMGIPRFGSLADGSAVQGAIDAPGIESRKRG